MTILVLPDTEVSSTRTTRRVLGGMAREKQDLLQNLGPWVPLSMVISTRRVSKVMLTKPCLPYNCLALCHLVLAPLDLFCLCLATPLPETVAPSPNSPWPCHSHTLIAITPGPSMDPLQPLPRPLKLLALKIQPRRNPIVWIWSGAQCEFDIPTFCLWNMYMTQDKFENLGQENEEITWKTSHGSSKILNIPSKIRRSLISLEWSSGRLEEILFKQRLAIADHIGKITFLGLITLEKEVPKGK